MSNQCSILLDFRSTSILAPFNGRLKPYSTLCPVIPSRRNLTITNRRSRRRTAPPVAAQSSPEIYLVATTEHHDGSVIFRFGDASEVPQTDVLVDDSEDVAGEESELVKVFDGDQGREVDSDGGITELADDMGAVTDGDVLKTETNDILGVGAFQEESSEIMLENSMENVVYSVSDDKSNYSLDDVEITPDVRRSSAQVDQDESPNPVVASISPSRDTDSEEAFQDDSDDETERQSTSVKLDPTNEVSHIEIIDSKEKTVGVSAVVTESDVVETESNDIVGVSAFQEESSERMLETSVDTVVYSVLDDNLNYSVDVENVPDARQSSATVDQDESPNPIIASISLSRNGDYEEAFVDDGEDETEEQSTFVKLEPANEVSHIKIIDGKEKTVEDIGDSDMRDVIPLSNSLETEMVPQEVIQVQPDTVEVEPTTQLSITEAIDAKDQITEDEMEQMNLDNSGENDLMDVVHVPSPVNIEAAMQVSTIEVSHDKLELNAEADGLESLTMVKQEDHDTLFEAERIESVVNSSEFAEVSGDGAVQFVSETNANREDISLADYILSSGAALLVHPPKALTGGDNAYFVGGNKWLGVADGVSQWSLEGTHSGVYAQELINTCQKIVLDGSLGPICNPVELLSKAIRETDASGSSTVLIAHFDGQVLQVANIGDTGFMIIRHGAVYKKSYPLFHEFNFPLQIERDDDPSQLTKEYRIELDEGDVVVSATDGLFDNLYEKEIAMIVSKSLQAAKKPEEIAKVLATRAEEVGRSAFVRSPFADAAQAAGYIGYAGGKPDDVAVIVSLVERRPNVHVE